MSHPSTEGAADEHALGAESGPSVTDSSAAPAADQQLDCRVPVRLDSTGDFYTRPTMTVSLLVKNTYELYDDVTVYQSNAVIPIPPDSETEPDRYDEWKYLHIYCFTGVGHEDGDSWYDVTILDCSIPELIGQEFDFGY